VELLAEVKWINFILGMVKNKDDIKALISLHKSKISSYGVKSLGLFGSYAVGSNTGGSDIDLLVEFELGKKSFDNFINLAYFLEEVFGKRVELVTPESLSQFFKSEIAGRTEYVAVNS